MNIRSIKPSEKFYEVSEKIIQWNTYMNSFKDSPGVDYKEIRKNAARLASSFSENDRGLFIGENELVLEEIKSPQDNKIKIIYIHGGGFVAGSLDNHRPFSRKMAEDMNSNIIMFDYPLAPEYPFPIPVDETIRAVSYVMDIYPDSYIGVLGDSAGANIALSALMKMRDSNMKLPDFGVFLSGFFNLTLSSDSISRNKDFDIVITKEFLEESVNLYSRGSDLVNPYISPVNGRFTDLPPLFFQVGASELLLDDSIEAYKKAVEYGVNASISIWPEMMHSFQSYSCLPEADIALEEIRMFIDQILKS